MDRITNEDNLWLNAIKMEDECNYFEAFVYYLKDSLECLKQNSLVKAALSCSCAAHCLASLGNIGSARQLYLEAARIYEENADHVIGDSIRESLWSFQEAYEYYLLGRNGNKAQKIYDKSIFLARKVNPFSGEDEVMKNLRMKKKYADDIMNMSQVNLQISSEVEEVIHNFMQLRKSYFNTDDEIEQTSLLRSTRGGNASEQSIAS